MNDHGVWKKIDRSTMPKDRRCVKSKWVFEVKRNGVFRARLVACGYTQIPGLDFTEAYSPVIGPEAARSVAECWLGSLLVTIFANTGIRVRTS